MNFLVVYLCLLAVQIYFITKDSVKLIDCVAVSINMLFKEAVVFLLSKLLCVRFIFRGQAPAVFVHFLTLLVSWESVTSLDQIWVLLHKLNIQFDCDFSFACNSFTAVLVTNFCNNVHSFCLYTVFPLSSLSHCLSYLGLNHLSHFYI